jgi:amino acid transporter
LTAVANTVKFEYSDGRTFLAWTVGLKVDAAVWIGLFLILATITNLFPVKVCCLMGSYVGVTVERGLLIIRQYFGELEYVFGSLKLAFISMLIVLMVILDTMKREYLQSHPREIQLTLT